MDRSFEFDKKIGQNIKRLREKSGLTQDELSSRLQTLGLILSRGTIEKIENGRRHIYTDELYFFHKELKADYHQMLPINDPEYEAYLIDLAIKNETNNDPL